MVLTQLQQQIIEDVQSSLLVSAPAGSGKTELMARRATNAAKKGKNGILCLTFTNRAANGMKKRIATMDCKATINVYTFHSFCNHILRMESNSLGIPYQYTILDEQDTADIIKDLLKKSSKTVSFHDIKAANTHLDDYRMDGLKGGQNQENIIQSFYKRFHLNIEQFYIQYNNMLKISNAIDFTSLITITYDFFNDQQNLEKWQHAYDFIQVDEMQDTTIIEYEIIAKLAKTSENLTLFGDINQTIYEWRGSEPLTIVQRFLQDFDAKQYSLTDNFRSTQHINDCAEIFLKNYYESNKKDQNHDDFSKMHRVSNTQNDVGEKINICFLKDSASEQKQVCRIISKLNKTIDYKDIAVLTRTNNDAKQFSHVLSQANIPSYLVDEYNFFRREEIKDVLSFLKLIKNPSDVSCAKRILLKFTKNIGITTIDDIINNDCCASLQDFLVYSHKDYDDFLFEYLQAYEQNNMIVFDVESTGLNTESDEIVEIAAVRFGQDGILDEFHEYICPNTSVGDSFAVHGYSNDFLKANGKDAEHVLREFLKFSENSMLCGHNVRYDLAILKSQLSRLNISHSVNNVFFDTLTASKRMIKDIKNYKLGTLVHHLGIEQQPTHHAMDDVYATCEVALFCFDAFIRTTDDRINFYKKYKSKFTAFSKAYESLTDEIQNIRPYEALKKIYQLLKLKEKYKSYPQKIENLSALITVFECLDDKNIDPKQNLYSIISTLTLSNSCERVLSMENKVSVITVHQAKGLQFKAVIITNVVEGSFPSSLNIKYDSVDQEARLFYVAMTRACEQLFLTLCKESDNNKKNVSSRFIKYLPKDHYIIHSQM